MAETPEGRPVSISVKKDKGETQAPEGWISGRGFFQNVFWTPRSKSRSATRGPGIRVRQIGPNGRDAK